MILILSGDDRQVITQIALGLAHHAAESKIYDGFTTQKPPDFPNSNRVLIIITIAHLEQYPPWIFNHPFTRLQTIP
jgi:hypothetical protein